MKKIVYIFFVITFNANAQDITLSVYDFNSVKDRFAMNYKELKRLYLNYQSYGIKKNADTAIVRGVDNILKQNKRKPLFIFILGRSDWTYFEIEQGGKVIPFWLSLSITKDTPMVMLIRMDKRIYYKFEKPDEFFVWFKIVCLSEQSSNWSNELKDYIDTHQIKCE